MDSKLNEAQKLDNIQHLKNQMHPRKDVKKGKKDLVKTKNI